MLCHLLTRGHLAGVPLSRTLWSHVATALDAASIDESPQHLVSQLLMASLLHPLTAAAPRDPAHTREVLEWLREQCQARGWHLPPELIHEALSHPGEVLEVYYKTYVGWGGSAVGRVGVTLLESGSGITHNTTGLTTWYGAAVLADWATDNEVLAGRRVVELGAGVGFTASVILTSTAEGRPPPTTYLLTDCHHHVLTLLHHNLTLNLASPPPKRQDLEVFQREVSEELVKGEVEAGEVVSWPPGGATTTPVAVEGGGASTEVSVMQVDWRHPPPLPPVDVVVASDVVYARHLIPALVTLIRSILDGSGSRQFEGNQEKQGVLANSKSTRGTGRLQGKSDEVNKKDEGSLDYRGKGSEEEERQGRREREAFIACTRRNQETLSVFLEEVSRQGLTYTLVYQATLHTDTALFLYNETHLPVKIYRITVPPPPPEPSCDA